VLQSYYLWIFSINVATSSLAKTVANAFGKSAVVDCDTWVVELDIIMLDDWVYISNQGSVARFPQTGFY